MKRVKITIELDASCFNCAYGYVYYESNYVLMCSKIVPHRKVEEDDYCKAWNLSDENDFNLLTISNAKVIS